MVKKRKTGVTYLVFLALALELLSYASVEFLFHRKLQALRPSYRQHDIYNGTVEDREWGVWGRPRYSGTITRSCFNIHYSFNSVGARDRERARRNDSGAPRSIALGDSFIQGYGVEPENRLSDILERTTGHEYLNFSSAFDFGPLQYWLLYERLAKHYDHDQVIIGLFPANDFTDNDMTSREWKELDRFRPYWRLSNDKHDFSVVYRGIANRGRGYPPTFSGLSFGGKLSYIMSCSYFLNLVKRTILSVTFSITRLRSGYAEQESDRLIATELIFKRLADSIGNRKKVILVIPTYEEVMAMKTIQSRGSRQFNDFLLRLTHMGYTVINLLDYQVTLSGTQNDDLYLRPCDGHWSPAGNEFVARIVARELAR